MPANWLQLLWKRRQGLRARRESRVVLKRKAILRLEDLENRWVPSVTPATTVVAASFFESSVYELNTSTGQIIDTLVAPNSQSTLANPAGMTVGPDGNLYFSSQSLFDPSDNSIVEYNVGSGQLATFIAPSVLNAVASGNGDSTFTPAGLAFGPDGNLYVSLNGGQGATSGGAVIRFDITNSGGVLSYAGTNTTIATGLVQPTEMSFGDTPSTLNTLYVSNSGGGITPGSVVAISQADSADPSTSTFIASGTGSLNYPAGLTWGSNGDLYVVDLAATDSHQGEILQFSATGKFEKVFTTPANALLYQFPSGMIFTSNGDLLTANLGPTYPVDFGGPGTDGSIYEFNTAGTFVKDLSSTSFPAIPTVESGVTYPVTGFSPSTLVMSAGDVAPTVNAGNGYTLNAGSSLTLRANGTDPSGFSLTYSWEINGHDVFGQATGEDPTLTWAQLTALGVTSGSSFTVEVMADDGHGQVVTSAPATVTINTLPVKVGISGPASVNEGSVYTLDLKSTSADGHPIEQWTINWGDGTQTQVSGTAATVQHTYSVGPNGYVISATATNSASVVVASNTLSVSVKAVPPKVTISGASSVYEEATYTLNLSALELGGQSIEHWNINWGDGSTQVVTGDPSSVTHVYADGPHAYTITASATDQLGTIAASDHVTVSVKHVVPTLTISGPTTITEGSTYTLDLSGIETGSQTIKNWTINWGDGSPVEVVEGNPSNVTHTYIATKAPHFTISATATDDVGTYAASDTVVVAVQHLAPIANLIGASTAAIGQAYTLNISAIEPLPNHTIEKVTINWGDGNTTVVTGDPDSATHLFKSDGNFTISVTVTDDIGTYAAQNNVAVDVT